MARQGDSALVAQRMRRRSKGKGDRKEKERRWKGEGKGRGETESTDMISALIGNVSGLRNLPLKIPPADGKN